MTSLVLVLMSTYNGEDCLEQQLDSIREQKGVNVNLIIRDDGSKDATIAIIDNYKKQYPDFFIELICGENVGFARSFSILLDYAIRQKMQNIQIEYFAFSDQDDIWLPEKLFMAINKLEAISDNNRPNVYCSNANLVDSNLVFLRLMNPVGSVKMTKESFLLRNIAVGCTMVFNYKALWYYTSYTPQYIRVHDYIMFLIGAFLGNIVYDDDAYINYRQHGNNQIGVPINFRVRMRKRIKRIKNKEQKIQENTLNAFLDSYKSFLDLESIYIISRVAFYKKNIWNRFSLFFSGKFTLDSFEKTFFVKLKILLGSL